MNHSRKPVNSNELNQYYFPIINKGRYLVYKAFAAAIRAYVATSGKRGDFHAGGGG